MLKTVRVGHRGKDRVFSFALAVWLIIAVLTRVPHYFDYCSLVEVFKKHKYFFLFLRLFWLFILKVGVIEREIFHVMSRTPDGYSEQHWTREKPGARNLILVSNMGGRCPNTWAFHYCCC